MNNKLDILLKGLSDVKWHYNDSDPIQRCLKLCKCVDDAVILWREWFPERRVEYQFKFEYVPYRLTIFYREYSSTSYETFKYDIEFEEDGSLRIDKEEGLFNVFGHM